MSQSMWWAECGRVRAYNEYREPFWMGADEIVMQQRALLKTATDLRAQVETLKVELADAEHTIQAQDDRLDRYGSARGVTKEILRTALGDTYGKLWGPELEELGRIVDMVVHDRNEISDKYHALTARLATLRAEALEEAAKAVEDMAGLRTPGIDVAKYVSDRIRALAGVKP